MDKQKRKKLKIVDAPDITMSEDDKAGDVLLKFYYSLGWNGEDILDPCKVRTTEAVYNHLSDLMREKCNDGLAVGMFMVNKAPGVDSDISPNKVHLLDGWVKLPEQQ